MSIFGIFKILNSRKSGITHHVSIFEKITTLKYEAYKITELHQETKYLIVITKI